MFIYLFAIYNLKVECWVQSVTKLYLQGRCYLMTTFKSNKTAIKLHKHWVLRSKADGQEDHKFLISLLVKHRKLYPYQPILSVLLVKLKSIVEYVNFDSNYKDDFKEYFLKKLGKTLINLAKYQVDYSFFTLLLFYCFCREVLYLLVRDVKIT